MAIVVFLGTNTPRVLPGTSRHDEGDSDLRAMGPSGEPALNRMES